MASWTTWAAEVSSSHRLQLGVTAVLSGCLAASAVIGLQNARRLYNVHDLKDSIPDLDSPHDVEKVGTHNSSIYAVEKLIQSR